MDQSQQPLPVPPRAGRWTQILLEWKTLGLLGGPILIAQLAQMANGVIDTIMAGHYSPKDLAAVGIGSSLWMPILLFFFGVLSALQPSIAGYLGAGQARRIIPTTWQGLYIGLASALLMILALMGAGELLPLLRLEPATTGITQGYLQAFVWGVPALMLITALRGLTDGLGHTRVIMAVSLLATLLNLPLNYVLIYGKLGLPALGGVGCGWATALSNSLAALVMLIYLNRSRQYRAFHLLAGWVAPHWASIAGLLRLGLPIGASMFVAGHQVVLNIVSLVFMLPLSLGMALTLRVSFLIGAGQPEVARRLARTTLLLALGIALVYMPFLLFGRELLVALYTGDPGVREVAMQLLVFAAIFQIADVLQVTAISALRGYRDTRLPLIIMLVSFWGLCLPLGYALTFTDWLLTALGAPGFWLALTFGLSCAGVLLIARLWRF